MADWLPDNWQVGIATRKDGTTSECYINKETGQTFHTKEALLRYVNYLRNNGPDVPNIKKHFMDDDETIFVERPWEKDSKHKMHDYIHGRVGKCKGMTPGSRRGGLTEADMRAKALIGKKPESNFAAATGVEMRETIIKGKTPESSFSLANEDW